MNWMNGVRVGGVRITSPAYAAGRRHMRRAIYLFLKYVVGWTEVSKVGSNWDNAAVAGAGDGATHASDAKIFNSATGGFSAIDPQSGTDRFYLIITGFADSERDGFYLIRQVVTDNQVYIDVPYCGTHTDGLPLNESGLTWRVDNLKASSLVPAVDDEWYMRGVGIGGNFQLHCDSHNDTNYSPDAFRVSPDDAVNWTAFTDGEDQPYTDSGLIFGCADMTHAYFWVRYYDYDMNAGYGYPSTYYFGDITAFRPADDTTPVVCFAEPCLSDWSPWAAMYDGPIKALTLTNVQFDERIIYPTIHGASSVGLLQHDRKVRSYYSGRLIREPITVVSIDNTYPEVRGTMKSIDISHEEGDRICTPFGTSRDQLRIARGSIPWNGSKQYYYVF